MYNSSEQSENNRQADDLYRSDDGGDTLFSSFDALTRSIGMSYFLVTRFPKGDMPEFMANHLISNWPEDLRDAYDAADSYGFSKVITVLKANIRPAFLEGAVFADMAGGEECEALFSHRKMGSHLAFSLHSADLNQFVFAFSGDREPMSKVEIRDLYFSVMEMLDTRFGQFAAEGPRERLSGRELECLRWSAAGKSSEEIALILSISTHTVVSYLKSAMRKLDSVNRMQAVARACRFRLL